MCEGWGCLQAVGVAFTSAAQHIERSPDDGQMVCADQMVCTREALDCLYQIFQLSKFPSALGIFETVVSSLNYYVHFPIYYPIIGSPVGVSPAAGRGLF